MKLKKYLLLLFVILSFIACNNQLKEEVQNKYLIAYNIFNPDSLHPQNYDIMIMNSDGSTKKNINNNTDVAWTYYAYKDRLFFISDRDTCYRCYFLYEMDKDGNNIKKVTNLQLEDSWMSSRNNGKELIVTGRIGKQIRYQLFLVNTKTGDYRQITNDTSALYRDPCFSPDGNQIVVSYQKNKRDKSQHEELFLMNADGSDMKQITTYPDDNPSANEHGYKAGAARWHPTENFISYVSKQDGQNDIFAVSPDGKKQWKLLENDFSEGWHDWSSDGNWLAFDTGKSEEKQFDVMLMNWKTKEMVQLTDTTYHYQQAPVFVEAD